MQAAVGDTMQQEKCTMVAAARSVSSSPLQLEYSPDLALGGTAGAADIPNMIGLGTPPVNQLEHEWDICTLDGQPRWNRFLIPLHAPLWWSKNRTGSDYQVMRCYQTAVRTHSLASSNVMASRLSSAPN